MRAAGLMWLSPVLWKALAAVSVLLFSSGNQNLPRPEERGGFVLGWTRCSLARGGMWRCTDSALAHLDKGRIWVW